MSTGDDYVSEFIINRRYLGTYYPIENSVNKISLFYPSLHYYLLQSFAPKAYRRFGLILNLTYDAIAGLVVFYFSLNFFKASPIGGMSSAEAGLSVLALFYLSPLLLPMHARIMGLKSRPMGSVIALTFFLALYEQTINPSYLCYGLLVLIVCLSIISSQISFQSIFFITLPLVIFSDAYEVLLIFPLSFILVLLLFKVNMYNYFCVKIEHFKWYANTLDTTMIRNRGLLRSFLRVFSDRRDLISGIKFLVSNNSVVIAATSFPLVFFAIYEVVINASPLVQTAPELLFFIYAGLAIFIITSIRPFVVAGEAERYLEAIAPFIIIWAVQQVSNGSYLSEYILLSMIIQVSFIILNFILSQDSTFRRSFSDAPSIEKEFAEVLSVLQKISSKMPFGVAFGPAKISFLAGSLLSSNPNIKILYSSGFDNNFSMSWAQEAFPSYLHLRVPFSFYKERYSVNFIVLSSYLLRHESYLNEAKKYKLIFKNNKYVVLQI